MTLLRRLLAIQAVLSFFCASPIAQPITATLFQNVRVFDGKSETLSAASNVLVVGSVITMVSTADIAIDPKLPVTVIAGGGRYIVVEPGQAEIAFVVVDAYQGQGIGSVLMRHLAALAREAGLKELIAEVLPENTAMPCSACFVACTIAANTKGLARG